MRKLKLIKGLSYFGVVKASKKNPYVTVADKETADRLIASGFFEVVHDVGDHSFTADAAQDVPADDKDMDDMFADSDDAEEDQDVSVMVELQQKSKAEVSDYAKTNGIDLSGCKTKDDMITKIIEDMARAAAVRQEIRS